MNNLDRGNKLEIKINKMFQEESDQIINEDIIYNKKSIFFIIFGLFFASFLLLAFIF